MNKRSTALALALAALASNAVADPISYEITFDVLSSGVGSPPFQSYLGYVVIDDALAKSGGSGQLVAYDFEFLQGPAFGTSYGNDRLVPFDGFGAGQSWVLHTPGFGGRMTFVDGVPTSFAYAETHDLGQFASRTMFIYDNGPVQHPDGYTWIWQTRTGALGTYEIGPAIPAIPEPTTWALLLAGLSMLSALSRRLRSSPLVLLAAVFVDVYNRSRR
jgi:hypothetical protein